MSDWVRISCATADVIRHSDMTMPYSSKTDLDGQFGAPEVTTTWCVHNKGADELVMRESRWPPLAAGEPDAKPCEHYAMGADARHGTEGDQ